MNSEELELSLRTEFENYLKEVFVEMRQELTQLQEKVESDLERHKSQLNEVFVDVLGKFETGKEIDASFKESVVEHLRLAKDEGAKITATAIAQAEELERETAKESAPAFGIKEIYEAVNDISQKTSQSEILKTLVHHATLFAPRGAFFIIKNEHLVGWRVFGKEKGEAEEKVREVFLPVSANSLLSKSVKSLETVESDSGFYPADAEIFGKLEFSEPSKMFAIPLVARGRGVAVLYADGGSKNSSIEVNALETLIRVAGLTVEVLASAKSSSSPKKVSAQKSSEAILEEEANAFKAEVKPETVESFTPAPSYQTVVTETVAEPSFVSEPVVETSYQTSFEPESFTAPSYEEPIEEESFTSDFVSPDSQVTETESSFVSEPSQVEEVEEETITPVTQEFAEETVEEKEEVVTPEETVEEEVVAPAVEKYPEFETTSWSQPVETVETTAPSFSAQEFAENFAKETDPTEYAKDFSHQPVEETTDFAFETPQEFVPTKEQTYGDFEVENGKAETAETVNQPISTPPKSRLSERNVDLPIEVSEDERRLHNDARRFARLLVSEIKLYNEQKVNEGRGSSDLYERLKEAIDRSREMYDKRVQPPVAAKFDYFHYELVNTLAEGDDNKLGGNYPGSNI